MPAKQKEQKERRFRVLGAPHYHDDGKTYVRGKVVRDTRNLCEMFVNKFQCLDEDDEAEAGMQQITDKPVDVMDIPKHHEEKLARGLKDKEDVDEDDEDVTDENRFGPSNPARAAAKKAATEEEDDRGVDLTEDFEGAGDKGLEVFKQGKNYTVYKGGKAMRNAAFTKKPEVSEFIDNHK